MFKKLDIEAEYLFFIFSLILIVGLIGYFSYKNSDAYMYSDPQKSTNTNGSAVSSKSGNSKSYTFSGSKTQVINLKEGLNEFDISYKGNSNFNAAILYSDGVQLESLATSKGTYKGITSVNAPESRSYLLSIQCGDNGEWTLTRR